MRKPTHPIHSLTAFIVTLALVLAPIFYFGGIHPAHATGGSTPTAIPVTLVPKHPRPKAVPEAVTSDGILTLGLIIVIILVAGTLWPRQPVTLK